MKKPLTTIFKDRYKKLKLVEPGGEAQGGFGELGFGGGKTQADVLVRAKRFSGDDRDMGLFEKTLAESDGVKARGGGTHKKVERPLWPEGF